MIHGIVTKFDPALCWGLVLGEDEVVYFVHSDDVVGERVVEGCRVEFTPGYARRRPRALEVRRLVTAPRLERSK